MSTQSPMGAFFDIDGTLLPWPSLEWRFIAYLASRDILGPAAMARGLGIALRNAAAGKPLPTGSRAYLSGVATSLVDEWLADLTAPLPVFDDGLRRLEWHAAQGHRIALVSGTLAPLARAFAQQIRLAEEIHATELDVTPAVTPNARESSTSFWTGHLASEWPSAAAKARIVGPIAAAHQLDLARSFAYGNSASDAAMLACVGCARAVNPSLGLRRIAAERRWLIEYWKSRGVSRGVALTSYTRAARAGDHQ
jgi:phosphoserine phosphatase